MSNDTKRDVFELALLDCAGLNDELYGYLLKQYDDALPDDMPVIPKAVGEILLSAYGQNNLLGILDTAKNGYKISDTLAWIIDNQDIFALAWVLGAWHVEKTGEIMKLELI